jgi:hypothetical protein
MPGGYTPLSLSLSLSAAAAAAAVAAAAVVAAAAAAAAAAATLPRPHLSHRRAPSLFLRGSRTTPEAAEAPRQSPKVPDAPPPGFLSLPLALVPSIKRLASSASGRSYVRFRELSRLCAAAPAPDPPESGDWSRATSWLRFFGRRRPVPGAPRAPSPLGPFLCDRPSLELPPSPEIYEPRWKPGHRVASLGYFMNAAATTTQRLFVGKMSSNFLLSTFGRSFPIHAQTLFLFMQYVR